MRILKLTFDDEKLIIDKINNSHIYENNMLQSDSLKHDV